jgi:exonuclease VII large subunit
MKIAVIIGKSAIIDSDIITALGSAVAHYDLIFVRVSIASIKEISDAILKFDSSDVELICVARGGGEQMEALNKTELVEFILDRKKIIASAIGHADDVSLFEKVADKRFTTPTAFGTYLKQIYDETIEELSKSKAKMQKDITATLTKIYDEQLKTLNGKLESTIKLYTQEKKTIIDSHENLKKQLIELNEKKIKDLNEAALKMKSELIVRQMDEIILHQ